MPELLWISTQTLIFLKDKSQNLRKIWDFWRIFGNFPLFFRLLQSQQLLWDNSKFPGILLFPVAFPTSSRKNKNPPKSRELQNHGQKNPNSGIPSVFPQRKPTRIYLGSFAHPFPCINLFPNFFGPSQASGFALPGGKEDFLKKKSGGKIPNFCIFPLLQELGIVFYFSQAGS